MGRRWPEATRRKILGKIVDRPTTACYASSIKYNNVVVVFMAPKTYSAHVAKGATGARQRWLEYWDEQGIVCPTKHADGKGTSREYSLEDLIKLRLVVKLRSAGLSLQRIQKAMRFVSKNRPKKELLLQVLSTDGERLEWKRHDGKIVDLLRGGQLVFGAVSLHAVEEEVKAKVLELTRDARTTKVRTRAL